MKHIFTYRILFIFMFFQLSFVAHAQHVKDTVSYGLKQLLTLAKENNKDARLLQLELQKANQDIELRKSNYFPKIDAFADYHWFWGNVPQYIFPENEGSILSGGLSNGFYPVSIGLPNNLLAGVSVSQRLFEFSYLSAGKSKKALENIEIDRIKENTEQLYYNVSACYFEISQLATKEDFIDFNVSRIEQFIGIVRVQLENQMTDSLSLLDLELKKAELFLNKIELQSGMQRKTNYLKMLVGLPDSIVMDYKNIEYYPVLEAVQYQGVNEENTQLSLLNNAQTLNEFSQKQIQSEYLPTLDFNFNLLWNTQSNNLNFFSDQAFGNHVSTLGLKLDIPIYHGDEKRKKMQKLLIDQDILELKKQKLLEGYLLQSSNSLEELKFKTDRYRHQQKITQLKQRYFDKANNQFKQGILPIKELLNEQSDLFEMQMKEVELLFDVKLAELNYYKWSNQILTKYE